MPPRGTIRAAEHRTAVQLGAEALVDVVGPVLLRDAEALAEVGNERRQLVLLRERRAHPDRLVPQSRSCNVRS